MTPEEFTASLAAAAKGIAPELRAVFRDGASDVRDKWRENARATSGTHGKLYPNTITFDTRELAGGILAEIGPDASRPQGGMSGFELGSQNQPPHLDGLHAIDEVAPNMERRFDAALGFLLP